MSDSRMRIWFSLFVLAVFCLGLGAGVLIGRRMSSPGAPFGPAFARPFGGERGRGGPPRGFLVERLTSELQLTGQQRTQIEGILNERRERLDRLQRDVHDRFEQEQRELRGEIRRLLTPDQQQKFDRWIESAPGGPGRRGRGF